MVRIGPYRFAPRAGPTTAAVLFIALTLWLGTWQVARRHEKEALQAMLEARLAETPIHLTGSVPSAEPLLFRHVRATGEWIERGQIFLDNKVDAGRAGFEVVTPLRLRGSDDAVLVDRGWIARSAAYPQAPAVPVPAGPVEVEGIATVPVRRYLELSSETIAGNVWQNLSLARYQDATKLRVLPIVVLQEPAAPGLVAVHATPDAGIDKHREYALTWFSLAATAFALWIALNTRRSP